MWAGATVLDSLTLDPTFATHTSSENKGGWAKAWVSLTFQQLFPESPHIQKPQNSQRGNLDLAFSFLEEG